MCFLCCQVLHNQPCVISKEYIDERTVCSGAAKHEPKVTMPNISYHKHIHIKFASIGLSSSTAAFSDVIEGEELHKKISEIVTLHEKEETLTFV